MTAPEPCRACGGHGRIYAPGASGNVDGALPCEACRTTGEQPAPDPADSPTETCGYVPPMSEGYACELASGHDGRHRCLPVAAPPVAEWDARYFDGDLSEEVERLATAMRISATEYPDTGTVSWRLITTQGPTEDDWLNLGFMGNGPCSRANARFCADAPALIRELVDALRAAGSAR